MVTFIDECRRKFPSCMVVKRLINPSTVSDVLTTNSHLPLFSGLVKNIAVKQDEKGGRYRDCYLVEQIYSVLHTPQVSSIGPASTQ